MLHDSLALQVIPGMADPLGRVTLEKQRCFPQMPGLLLPCPPGMLALCKTLCMTHNTGIMRFSGNIYCYHVCKCQACQVESY